MRKTIVVIAAVIVLGHVARALELPLDEIVDGSTHIDEKATYIFEADGAGALTIVVRSTDQSDVAIVVTDSDDRQLEGGRIDIDYQSDTGAEQGLMLLPRAGEYRVIVEPLGSEATFVLAASWLLFDALERPEDPDGSPATAILLSIDEWVENRLDTSLDDIADWYRVEAESDGDLTVSTRAAVGDLVIEGYMEDEFSDFFERSDQDINGDFAHESIELEVEEGDVLFFKITSLGGDFEYEIRAELDEEGEENVEEEENGEAPTK